MLFELLNIYTLSVIVLLYILFNIKNLKNTEKSIEQKAGDVLERFRMKRLLKASITKYDGNKEVTSTNDDKIKQSYKQRYLEDILRLKEVPKPIS